MLWKTFWIRKRRKCMESGIHDEGLVFLVLFPHFKKLHKEIRPTIIQNILSMILIREIGGRGSEIKHTFKITVHRLLSQFNCVADVTSGSFNTKYFFSISNFISQKYYFIISFQ
jgi:hypothetical protein